MVYGMWYINTSMVYRKRKMIHFQKQTHVYIPQLQMLCFVLSFAFLIGVLASKESAPTRGAIVITLSGPSKLSEYFEWSCRSVGASASLFDMLVFHEANEALKHIECAANVIFIDLGPDGMSHLLAEKVLTEDADESVVVKTNITTSASDSMFKALKEVFHHVPRLLIEIKPMTGYLFKEWLKSYSHWTYSDPDILWGNLADWIPLDDMEYYDVLTIAKTLDAGRLFIRGQFALHKNTERVNNMWKKLEYLSARTFSLNVGVAVGMVRSKKSADEIYGSVFHSAEGWYSSAVFQTGVSVKVLARGFDDFHKDPVVWFDNQIVRCSKNNLEQCLTKIQSRSFNATTDQWAYAIDANVEDLPKVVPMKVQAYKHKTACYMQWLPTSLRYCIGVPAAAKQGNSKSSDDIKLMKVGEVFMNSYNPMLQKLSAIQWTANNEKVSRRQLRYTAAFFHFRHWDDYASKGIRTRWPVVEDNRPKDPSPCMVLHITRLDIMAYEPCDMAIQDLMTGQDAPHHTPTIDNRGEGKIKGKGDKGGKKSLRGKRSKDRHVKAAPNLM